MLRESHKIKLNLAALLAAICAPLLLLVACSPEPVPSNVPAQTPEPAHDAETATPVATPDTPATEEPEPLPEPPAMKNDPPAEGPAPAVDNFDTWWQDFKTPLHLDTSPYPAFYRGAWASRLDEARSYLLNAYRLRESGVDTILLGVDVVFDRDTGDAVTPGEEVFIFYLQAFRKAGFRVILIPNPMHPTLDMGEGYEWDEPNPDVRYHRGYKLITKLDSVVLKWAGIAETYHADGIAPSNEPYKLVRDYHDASRWLQEILPGIRELYSGKILAIDTMYSEGQGPGLSVPYPYDYSGYDLILGGPPSGRKNIEDWEDMLQGYLQAGNDYVASCNATGFGLYEWGGYTGGVWFEPIPEDQLLNPEQAAQITESTVRQATGTTIASFPRVSTGWLDFDTPAFRVLSDWYRDIGGTVEPPDGKMWTCEELIDIENRLGGDEYEHIFQIE